MSEVSNLTKADKIIRWGMTFSLIFFVFSSLLLALFYLKLPPLVPLFNQLPWGEDRLGAKFEFFIPIVITAFFFIFNYTLLRKLYITMPLVSRILGITTLLASLLLFIFVVRTLQIIL